MIRTRFDQINSLSNQQQDTWIMTQSIYQVPAVGQVINLNDNPFVVYDIGWAIADGDDIQYCYVRCLPRPAAQK